MPRTNNEAKSSAMYHSHTYLGSTCLTVVQVSFLGYVLVLGMPTLGFKLSNESRLPFICCGIKKPCQEMQLLTNRELMKP